VLGDRYCAMNVVKASLPCRDRTAPPMPGSVRSAQLEALGTSFGHAVQGDNSTHSSFLSQKGLAIDQ